MKTMLFACALAISGGLLGQIETHTEEKQSFSFTNANFTNKEIKVTEWFEAPINSIVVTSVNINTSDLELGGMVHNGKFYFTSDRYDENGTKFSKTQEPHLDLFEAMIQENGEVVATMRVRGDINSNMHEGFCSFSADGNKMYFSHNERDGNRRVADQNNVSHLKICEAEKINGQWTNVYELECNVFGFSLSHPALSKDGSKLFFTGDLPGGHGGKDLWYSDLRSDGSWSEPINLGPEINTDGDECYPYIAYDGCLFFASDGHPGHGGLDIFRFNHLDPNNPLEILPKGINSKYDDFSFNFDHESKRGFFSSDRSRGKGSDDIYQFRFLDKITANQ